MLLRLNEFVEMNTGTAPAGKVWDSLKAYLRGLIIQQVAKTKGKSREWERDIRREVMQEERQPTLDRQREWLDKQQE